MFKHYYRFQSKADNPEINFSVSFIGEHKDYDRNDALIIIANELRKRKLIAFADSLDYEFRIADNYSSEIDAAKVEADFLKAIKDNTTEDSFPVPDLKHFKIETAQIQSKESNVSNSPKSIFKLNLGVKQENATSQETSNSDNDAENTTTETNLYQIKEWP